MQGLIQSETVDYYTIFSNWNSIKLEEKGKTIEALFQHAKQTKSLLKFLEDMILSSYIIKHNHSRREKSTLTKLIENIHWIDYATKILKIEESDEDLAEEVNKEKNFNTAEFEIHYDLNKYDLLNIAMHIMNEIGNEKNVLKLINNAFNLGHAVGFKFLLNKGFGFPPESEYEDVYNLVHQDLKYKPAIKKAKKIFEEKHKELASLNVIEEYRIGLLEEQGFEVSLRDESFSYLICIPYFEEIKKLNTDKKVEFAKEIFKVLYNTATFAFHLVIKEKVEKQLQLHSEVFGNLDLSIYNQFHKV